MKRFYFIAAGLLIIASFFAFGLRTTAQNENSAAVSPNIVISQFQVAGSSANDEFIELHNTSSAAVDLNGLRLVYRSASGTGDVAFVNWTSSTIVAPGAYYLIASTAYDDSVTPDITYNPSTCSCSMSASGGGLAIRSGNPNTGTILDSVGYGTATNAFIEGATTAAPPANAGQARQNNGCQDTDNNANDFSTFNPSAPRGSSSPNNPCGGGATAILAGGAANPGTVAPGATTLITVTVYPATTPPSSGIAVAGNLTGIGGAVDQKFYDDGTNGDATAGDNIFSFQATISNDLSGGVKSVTATVSDAQARTASVSINLTINAPYPNEEPLLLGNPTNATIDVANENNYLMVKPQYTLSYNRGKAEPNWVAWRLDSSWIGTTPRQDDFRPDPQLPADWYHVLTTDYSGSGYDRGHMCPSGDRTRSIPDNSATFLMTNFVPQLAANNQGPWEEFESYCRTLAQTGNELYIVSGGAGVAGTIAGGKIVVPQVTWKVVLVLPNGDNDLQRVGKGTRTIAIIVPNQPPLDINAPWRNFRVSVNAVETLTGYDFFSNVPKNTQELIERKKDRL